MKNQEIKSSFTIRAAFYKWMGIFHEICDASLVDYI